MSNIDECQVLTYPTMHGLIKWEKNMFKKLGWMVLGSKMFNLTNNVADYKCGLARLNANLNQASYEDNYKNTNIKIMKENLDCLTKFAEANLSIDNNLAKKPHKIPTNNPEIKALPVTTFGLEGWFVHSFKKLGWMIVAKHKHGLKTKVNEYYYSVCRLALSLEKKIASISIDKKDKKEDLQKLVPKVHLLLNFIEANLLNSTESCASTMEGGKRRGSKKSSPSARKNSKKSSQKVKKSSRK
jgi:hypothetical protein